MMYPIVEIFDSIQGEGAHLGKPCTFIRFAGCNLNCLWCDTVHSLGLMRSLDDIVDKIGQRRVVLTGGEPTLQDLQPLITEIRSFRPEVQIHMETNGTNPTKHLELDWVTCSPKRDAQHFIHPECSYNELKLVVDNALTLDELVSFLYTVDPQCDVWLQPEGSKMQEMWQKAVSFVPYSDHLRVGLQLHKLMEVR